MRPLHQFIPTLARNDAVGRHTLEVQKVLRAYGVESEIFTENTPEPALRSVSRPYGEFGADGRNADAVLLYQASTGSLLSEWLYDRTDELVINYHNITPAEFFQRWEPSVAAELIVGRHQIEQLAAVTQLAIADSSYNAGELADYGYVRTSVVPILFDATAFHVAPDQRLAAELAARRGTHWLFVGRIAPNKCQHDVVKAFAYFRRLHDPAARLTLVGKSASHRYYETLMAFIAELGLSECVEVVKGASPEKLTAHFEAADVFVCLSEHEGFCVPLLEAMYHELPVVAYRAAAVPETAGDGALLLDSKSPAVVAAAVHRVCSDSALSKALTYAGIERLTQFTLEHSQQLMWDLLEPLVS
ncbi:MAG: glycosyltransferase [Acidimicrobiia bacterium]